MATAKILDKIKHIKCKGEKGLGEQRSAGMQAQLSRLLRTHGSMWMTTL